jgi:hypothetical protein
MACGNAGSSAQAKSAVHGQFIERTQLPLTTMMSVGIFMAGMNAPACRSEHEGVPREGTLSLGLIVSRSLSCTEGTVTCSSLVGLSVLIDSTLRRAFAASISYPGSPALCTL